jgi:hypothetical protein
MSMPSTPLDVVKMLGELTRQLRDQVRAYGQAEQNAAELRHASDMVEARAFLAASGSVEQRKNEAKVAADRPELDAKVAEALVKILKARIRVIETEIDCARTAGATFRAELSTVGYGGEGA